MASELPTSTAGFNDVFLPQQTPLNTPWMYLQAEPLLNGFGQLFGDERGIVSPLLNDKLHNFRTQLVPALRAALVRQQTEYAVLLEGCLRWIERRREKPKT